MYTLSKKKRCMYTVLWPHKTAYHTWMCGVGLEVVVAKAEKLGNCPHAYAHVLHHMWLRSHLGAKGGHATQATQTLIIFGTRWISDRPST